MTVQVALTPDSRWTWPTAELLTAAAAAGFASVGITAQRATAATADAYTAAGLGCHELMVLVVGDDEAQTVASAEHLAGVVGTVGARWVLTVFTAPPKKPVLRRCAEVIGDSGAALAAEFSPLGPVATIADGLAAVRMAQDGGPAGLLIDSWHFCFGESTWTDLRTVALDDIAYVQFTDALEPDRQRMVREALHRRALPGAGVLELERFTATLLDRGYDGVVSAEVLSAELRELPVDVLVRRIHDATTRHWR